MDLERGSAGLPVIALGVRLLRVSRTGPRSVEVIAEVRYQETSRGPIREKGMLVPVHLPPHRPTTDLRQIMLDGVFTSLARHRRIDWPRRQRDAT